MSLPDGGTPDFFNRSRPSKKPYPESMRLFACAILVSTAAAQSVDSAAIERFRDNLAAKNARALYVVKDGKVILEWYADGVTATDRQGEASLSKALVGGMSLLLATADGPNHPTDAAAKFIP